MERTTNWEASYEVKIESFQQLDSTGQGVTLYETTITDLRMPEGRREIAVVRATPEGAVQAAKEYIEAQVWRLAHRMDPRS